MDSAYFLPNLKCWIDESDMYPYIGGDSMKDAGVAVESQSAIPSLNLLHPSPYLRSWAIYQDRICMITP